MNVPFHIDQINEVLKYLDDVPHKFSRGLIDYIKNHVENHVKQTENDSKEVTTETQVEQVTN